MSEGNAAAQTPELPEFVDAHHHLQDLTGDHYPWLQQSGVHRPLAGDISGIQRSYFVDDLRRDLAGVKLVKSVHIQNGWDPNDSAGETRWVQAQVQSTGLPSAIVGYADLSDPRVGDLLEAHAAASPNFRGVRQILKWHRKPELSFASRPDLADDASWRRGYALLKQFNLSFDAQVYPPQLPGIARLAADFPETTLVLGHAGVPLDRSAGGFSTWISGMKTLSRETNAYVKLSGYGLYGGRDWSIEEIGGLMLRIIDIFGPDRCMCASNLPVETLYSRPQAITDVFRWIASRFTPAEALELLRTTAERAYRI